MCTHFYNKDCLRSKYKPFLLVLILQHSNFWWILTLQTFQCWICDDFNCAQLSDGEVLLLFQQIQRGILFLLMMNSLNNSSSDFLNTLPTTFQHSFEWCSTMAKLKASSIQWEAFTSGGFGSDPLGRILEVLQDASKFPEMLLLHCILKKLWPKWWYQDWTGQRQICGRELTVRYFTFHLFDTI